MVLMLLTTTPVLPCEVNPLLNLAIHHDVFNFIDLHNDNMALKAEHTCSDLVGVMDTFINLVLTLITNPNLKPMYQIILGLLVAVLTSIVLYLGVPCVLGMLTKIHSL